MDEIDAALAEQDRLARQVEEAVRDSIDPYPFALALLGHVFRGALASPTMGGDEPRAIGVLHDTVGSVIADDDPDSLTLFSKGLVL